jgi:hypothetical protein
MNTEEQVRCSLCFGTCKIYIFGEYDNCYRCDGIGWYNKGYYIELDENLDEKQN